MFAATWLQLTRGKRQSKETAFIPWVVSATCVLNSPRWLRLELCRSMARKTLSTARPQPRQQPKCGALNGNFPAPSLAASSVASTYLRDKRPWLSLLRPVVLLDFVHALWQLNGGLFDVTSGVLRRAWDFKAGKLPKPQVLQTMRYQIRWQHVKRHDGQVRLAGENPASTRRS